MISSLILYTDSELLEGPVFDRKNKHLYFVSILEGLVYCYTPSTKEILSIRLESPTSCIYILERKKVLAASMNGFFEINFDNLTKQFAFQIKIDDFVRYNDGIQDPIGRFIIGTMGFPDVTEYAGNVFSYHDGNYKRIIKNTTISNGLAFSPDGQFLYFIDTPTKKVAKYNYDLKSGEVTFNDYVIEFEGNGSPDGMCIDSNGMLWIAEWGGSCVAKWNPENGLQLEKITLPCSNVTSCCFDNLYNLYVTTAKSNLETDIYGGGLFYVELNK